jgi:hypothetical protein
MIADLGTSRIVCRSLRALKRYAPLSSARILRHHDVHLSLRDRAHVPGAPGRSLWPALHLHRLGGLLQHLHYGPSSCVRDLEHRTLSGSVEQSRPTYPLSSSVASSPARVAPRASPSSAAPSAMSGTMKSDVRLGLVSSYKVLSHRTDLPMNLFAYSAFISPSLGPVTFGFVGGRSAGATSNGCGSSR